MSIQTDSYFESIYNKGSSFFNIPEQQNEEDLSEMNMEISDKEQVDTSFLSHSEQYFGTLSKFSFSNHS